MKHILSVNICNVCNADKKLNHKKHCPKCDSCPSAHEVRGFDRMWGEGDVYCTWCETFVRSFDSD